MIQVSPSVPREVNVAGLSLASVARAAVVAAVAAAVVAGPNVPSLVRAQRGSAAQSNECLQCVARYSNYRRAEVTSRIVPDM